MGVVSVVWRCFRLFIASFVALLLALQPMVIHAANITPADPNIILDQAQNNVPVVDIVAPSAAGVSHNKFQDFSVGKEGVILNNSNQIGVSQLGGVLPANSNFGTGSTAKLILNEVVGTSSSRSNLEGYTEIFGDSAEYILANPNGITCKGCGFINAPRATLTTGIPQFQSGALESLNVQQGDVLIEAVGVDSQTGEEISWGLNTSSDALGEVEYFDVVAETIKVQGEIWGGDEVALKAGRNVYRRIKADGDAHYSYEAESLSQNSGVIDAFAIDGSALGAMYAGRISLEVTQEGMGVKTDAELAASVDDIVISADGKIQYKKLHANQDIKLISSATVEAGEEAYATRDLSITAEMLDNEGGTLQTEQGDITIAVNQFHNYGNAVINAAKSVDVIATANMTNEAGSSITALDNVSIIDGGNALRLFNYGLIRGDTGVQISAKELTNDAAGVTDGSQGAIVSLGDVIVDLYDENVQLGTVAAEGKLTFNMHGNNFINSGIVTSDQRLEVLGANDFTNLGKVVSEALGDIVIDIDGTFSNDSLLLSDNHIAITAGKIVHGLQAGDNSAADIIAKGDVLLDAENITTAVGSFLYAQYDLNIYADYFTNVKADVVSLLGDIVIQGDSLGTKATNITNSVGRIEAMQGDLVMQADSVQNLGESYGTHSTYLAYDFVIPTTSYGLHDHDEPISLFNTTYAFMKAGRDVVVVTDQLTNNGGEISAGRDVDIDSGSIDNITSPITVTGLRRRFTRCPPATFVTGACLGHAEDVRKKGHINLETGFRISPLLQWIEDTGGSATVYSRDLAKIKAGRNVDATSTVRNTGGAIKAPGSVHIDGNVDNEDLSPHENPEILYAPDSVTSLASQIKQAIFDGNDSLFRIASPTHRYFIETDPNLTSVDQFLQTEYFFERLGIDLSSLNEKQILADDLYTARLISQAAESQIDQRYFVEDVVSEQEQLTKLFDNAVLAQADLNLTMGVALSAEMVNQLKEPIVWYVDQQIQGRDVLVPTLYLPEATIASLTYQGGAGIYGGDVDIEGEYLRNDGSTIFAKNDLQITADEVVNNSSDSNRAVIKAGNEVDIVATGDITNRGADIVGGKKVRLVSTEGNVKNIAVMETAEYGGRVDSKFTQAASIVSGGDLEVDAGKSFINTAARVAAEDNATINAAEDIKFSTLMLYNKQITSRRSGRTKSTTTHQTWRHIGSDLDVGSLNMVAGRDIDVIGSGMRVAGNASIDAKRDFNVLSVTDKTHTHTKGKREGGLFSADTHFTRTDISYDNKASDITIGGNLLVNATGADGVRKESRNINIVGSNINVIGNGDLNAGGSLNILAATETTISENHKWKKGAFSSMKKGSKTRKTTQVASSLDFGGALNTSSGGDTMVLASKIHADGDLDMRAGSYLDAGGKEHVTNSQASMYVVSAKDIEDTSSYYSKSKFGLSFSKGGIDVAKFKKTKNKKYSTKNAASSISSDASVTLDAQENLHLIGSTVEASLDATLDAGNDILVAASADYMREEEELIQGAEGLRFYAVSDGKKGSLDNMSWNTSEMGATYGQRFDYKKKVTEETTYKHGGAFVKAGRNLLLDAGNDVTLSGALLKSGGDATVNADNNINILAVRDTKNVSDTSLHVEVGIKASAGQKVTGAAKDIYETSTGMGFGDGSPMGTGVAAVQNIMKVKDTVGKVAGALKSPVSAGVSVYAEVDGDVKDHYSEVLRASEVIVGGNLVMDAKNDILVEGANRGMDGNLRDTIHVKGDATVNADGTFEMRAASTQGDILSAELDMKADYELAGTNGMSASISMKGREESSKQYNNAKMGVGGKLTVNTGKDARFMGANVMAKDVDLNVAGDLKIVSVVDKVDGKSLSINASEGANTSGEHSSGVGAGGGFKRIRTVGTQSSIRGSNSVDIEVGNHTRIEGAVIAAGTADKPDANLRLSTNTISYSDITNQSHDYNFGVNVSEKTEAVKKEPGAFEDTASYSGEVDLNIYLPERNLATIGAGVVEVRSGDTGGLDGINRDVGNTQEGGSSFGLSGSADLSSDGELSDILPDNYEEFEQMRDNILNPIGEAMIIENWQNGDAQEGLNGIGELIADDEALQEIRDDFLNPIGNAMEIENWESGSAQAGLDDIGEIIADEISAAGTAVFNAGTGALGDAQKAGSWLDSNVNIPVSEATDRVMGGVHEAHDEVVEPTGVWFDRQINTIRTNIKNTIDETGGQVSAGGEE